MRQANQTISCHTDGPGLYEQTEAIFAWVAAQGIADGLLTVFCRHTSASLLIQENAAHEVKSDIIDWLNRLAPEDGGWRHDSEGPDDMPAHLKSLLTGVSLSIPVVAGRPSLGTWQGVFLAEHRAAPHRRQIVLHLIGD